MYPTYVVDENEDGGLVGWSSSRLMIRTTMPSMELTVPRGNPIIAANLI